MNIVDDNTDDFVKQAVKIASLEKPSNTFVPSVMDKIKDLAIEEEKLPVSSSIISWKGWVLIGVICATIFALLFRFDSSTLSFSVFYHYFDKITSPDISYPVSQIFLTGVLAFVFYTILQITFSLKRLNEPKKA